MDEIATLKNKKLILKIVEQKHKELVTKYQILSASVLAVSGSFALAYASNQIEAQIPLDMAIFSIIFGLVGFIGISLIFNEYFKELKTKIKTIGDK